MKYYFFSCILFFYHSLKLFFIFFKITYELNIFCKYYIYLIHKYINFLNPPFCTLSYMDFVYLKNLFTILLSNFFFILEIVDLICFFFLRVIFGNFFTDFNLNTPRDKDVLYHLVHLY